MKDFDVTKYKRVITGVLFKMNPYLQKADIEDLIQEVYIKIFSSSKLKEEQGINKYIALMTRTTYIDKWRKENNGRAELFRATDITEIEDYCELKQNLPEYTEDQIEKLYLYIEKLSAKEQKAINLKLQGYKDEEIATLISTTYSTTKGLIHRAKNKLKLFFNGVAPSEE